MPDAPPPIRRIVTGHDANNVATVLWDAPAENVERSPLGARTLLWSTQQTPCDISIGADVEDEGLRRLGTQPPVNGTRFTINDVAPGAAGSHHRTESLDYAVVISGEVTLELDEGKAIRLAPGDVVIQRGTNHTWINTGSTWARLLFVLMDAQPLGIGQPLAAGTTAGIVHTTT